MSEEEKIKQLWFFWIGVGIIIIFIKVFDISAYEFGKIVAEISPIIIGLGVGIWFWNRKKS